MYSCVLISVRLCTGLIRPRIGWGLLVVVLSLSSLTFAQCPPLCTAPGAAVPAEVFDSVGYSVASIGDADGDGIGDYAVGAPGDDAAGLNAGAVYIFSGAACAPMPYSPLLGAAPGDNFGRSIASVGDVNLDGFSDFAVGAPGADPFAVLDVGVVTIHSGLTGAPIFLYPAFPAAVIPFIPGTSNVGWSVAGLGLVDGDIIPDILVGAPGYDGPGGVTPDVGAAVVVSTATGLPIYPLIPGAFPGAMLGYSVAAAGLLDADLITDFIAGAPDLGGPSPGYVSIHSGAAGVPAPYSPIFGAAAADQFGFSVAGVGDVSSPLDGVPDFVVGANLADPLALGDEGAAYLFSGATGVILCPPLAGAAAGDNFGTSVAGPGDVSGNGIPDFLVGAPFFDPVATPADAGAAFAYSGSSCALLCEIDGTAAGQGVGFSVAGAGTVDANPVADIIVGAPAGLPQIFLALPAAFVYPLLKGDMNCDGILTAADVVLHLNCTFLGIGATCESCIADLNCDGIMTAADVVNLLNFVFLGTPPPC